ncbi:hypothetical protein LJC68_01370 [Bacteroidales bacterium OttesenSCG-928-B11]|nr:hypothetical protein [Bacteroidales bacterium OttesenSCG-928-C03]MDL2311513.1 hypothetical protein [Bacteroidales bacterium OttesenSCG-928-B11]MDL2325652.1 hypothetical protein [Bacteroidales bacterium OttesenSCG-928-A14]
MKAKSKTLFLIILSSIISHFSLLAQRPVHVFGQVLDEYKIPISEAKIAIPRQARTITTDSVGFFSFFAYLGDNVVFSKADSVWKFVTIDQAELEVILIQDRWYEPIGNIMSVRGDRSEKVISIEDAKKRKSSFKSKKKTVKKR